MFSSALEQAIQLVLGPPAPSILDNPSTGPSTPVAITIPQSTPLIVPGVITPQPLAPTVVETPSPLPLGSTDPGLDTLYREGVKARAQENLAEAADLWQKVLDRDPHYGNDLLQQQMKELLQQRLDAWYKAGIKARAQGNISETADLWQKVLDLRSTLWQ